MSNRKKQYYVVVNGRKPGWYSNWFGPGQAAEQVQGYPQALYQGFFTREDAIRWLKELPPEKIQVENIQTLPPDLAKYIQAKERDSTTLSEAPMPSMAAGAEITGKEKAIAGGKETDGEVSSSEKVIIYTDGGALTNPGRGGYGVVLQYQGHRKELSGGFRRTTNNRMEILACIEGLRALKRRSEVIIFSDSRYVVNSMSKGWARRWKARGWMRNQEEKAENSDLWEQMLELCAYHTVEFRWLRGHQGTLENERCDELATQAAHRKDLPADEVYEKLKSAQPES